MEFRVMDEAVDLGELGLALVVNEGECDAICNGCRIRDIRGTVHIVQSVSEQEGLTVLYLRDGDAAYFERLFRDIFVDATLFTLLSEEA